MGKGGNVRPDVEAVRYAPQTDSFAFCLHPVLFGVSVFYWFIISDYLDCRFL